jgi:hypothetical protein
MINLIQQIKNINYIKWNKWFFGLLDFIQFDFINQKHQILH